MENHITACHIMKVMKVDEAIITFVQVFGRHCRAFLTLIFCMVTLTMRYNLKGMRCNGMGNHMHYGCSVKLFPTESVSLDDKCSAVYQTPKTFLILCALLPSSGRSACASLKP